MRKFLMSQAVVLACWLMASAAQGQDVVQQYNAFHGSCDTACAPAQPCCPKLWGSVEFIRWKIRECDYPALVTGSTDPLDFGILGAPTTTVLHGGKIGEDTFNGLRFTAGVGFGNSCSCCCWGFEAGFFFLKREQTNFSLTCDETVTVARPFFDALNGAQSSQLVCSPLILDANGDLVQRPLAGTIGVNTSTRLWGAEANLTQNCWWDPCGKMSLTLLYGFRYLSLDESITINEALITPDTDPVAPGEINLVTDQFSTRNRFYGGQVGAKLERRFGRFSVELVGKVGMGVTQQSVDIRGGAVNILRDQDPVFLSSGLYAATSNIGHYDRSKFSFIYELGINAGYYLTDNVRVFGGYNFIGWTNVVRPCDAIDTNINPDYTFGGTGANNPDPRVPAFRWKDSNF